MYIQAEEYCNSASNYRIHAESIDGDTISIDASLITVLETGLNRLSISFDSALAEFEENNKYSVIVETFTTEGTIGNSTGEFNISKLCCCMCFYVTSTVFMCVCVYT